LGLPWGWSSDVKIYGPLGVGGVRMDTLGALLCGLAQGHLPVGFWLGAAVFDVDGTLLHGGAPLTAVCDLLRHCARSGVECYAVTARLDFPEGRARLEADLHCAGVAEYLAGVYMRPVGVRARTLAAFKADCRGDIALRRRRAVVLCVGDQWHDLPTLRAAAAEGDVSLACVSGCICLKLPAVPAVANRPRLRGGGTPDCQPPPVGAIPHPPLRPTRPTATLHWSPPRAQRPAPRPL
jgi:hypothetical protein